MKTKLKKKPNDIEWKIMFVAECNATNVAECDATNVTEHEAVNLMIF